MKNALICWFAAMLLAAAVTGCGGPMMDTSQETSALSDFPLVYTGHSQDNQVGKDCADPRSTAGTDLEWKWKVVGVPTDYLPVLMRTEAVVEFGTWRASAITQAIGDTDLGRCDANGRWPLVFRPTYDPATGTNTWVLWAEPLHAGDPRTGSTFSVFFIDSMGIKARADKTF